MSIELSGLRIELPKADVDRFMAAVEKMSEDLDYTHKQALRYAGQAMLKSLAASTKVSKRFRKYRQIGVSRSGMNKVFEVDTKYTTPKRKGKALRRSWQGDWRKQLIYATSEAELLKRPAVIIAMRGVAKSSWLEAGKKGKFAPLTKPEDFTRDARNKRIMLKAARRWVKSDAVYDKVEQYIAVYNDIRHIESALKGGKMSASTALERAAKGMEYNIEKKVERAARSI